MEKTKRTITKIEMFMFLLVREHFGFLSLSNVNN